MKGSPLNLKKAFIDDCHFVQSIVLDWSVETDISRYRIAVERWSAVPYLIVYITSLPDTIPSERLFCLAISKLVRSYRMLLVDS